MRTRVLPRGFTLLIFEHPTSRNYSASVQVVPIGDGGALLHTLTNCGRRSHGFYQVLAEKGLGDFTDLGLTYVLACIKRSHLRRLVQSIGHMVDVTVTREFEMQPDDGGPPEPMVRIEIREKGAGDDAAR